VALWKRETSHKLCVVECVIPPSQVPQSKEKGLSLPPKLKCQRGNGIKGGFPGKLKLSQDLIMRIQTPPRVGVTSGKRREKPLLSVGKIPPGKKGELKLWGLLGRIFLKLKGKINAHKIGRCVSPTPRNFSDLRTWNSKKG